MRPASPLRKEVYLPKKVEWLPLREGLGLGSLFLACRWLPADRFFVTAKVEDDVAAFFVGAQDGPCALGGVKVWKETKVSFKARSARVEQLLDMVMAIPSESSTQRLLMVE